MALTSRVSSLSHSSFIEPLESRIAPAVLVYGANLLGGSGNPATGESSSGEHAATLVKVLSGQALVWFDGEDIVGISVGPNTSLEIWGDVKGDIVGNLIDGHLSDSDGNVENGYDGSKLLANNILGIVTHPLTGGELGASTAASSPVEPCRTWISTRSCGASTQVMVLTDPNRWLPRMGWSPSKWGSLT